MIITCTECSTRFNLDDSLVKPDGSTVRCSICKHIFTAYPDVTDAAPDIDLSMENPALEPDPDFDPSLDAPELSEPDLNDDFSLEMADEPDDDLDMDLSIDDDGAVDVADDDFELDSVDFEDAAPDMEIQDDLPEQPEVEMDLDDDMGFSFEDDDLKIQVDTDETTQEDDTIEFDGLEFEAMDDTGFGADDTEQEVEGVTPLPDSPEEDEEDFELEFDIEEENDPPPLEIEILPETETPDSEVLQDDPSIDQEAENDPPIITPEDDFSAYDDVLAQETEPDPEIEPEIEEEIEAATKKAAEIDDQQSVDTEISAASLAGSPATDISPKRRIRKKKSGISAPILVILLLFMLVAAAYVASIMTGYKIPYLSEMQIPYVTQTLKKSAPQTENVRPLPDQQSVNGRFVTNANAGTLFVITGQVENPSRNMVSHIEILGALITKGKEEATTKQAFCGNIISEEMLKSGTMEEINSLLAQKQGTHGANVNIKPGARVPFMVVFSDLPDQLQNFTVRVTGFEENKP